VKLRARPSSSAALLVCTLELMGWGLGEAAFSAPPLGLAVIATLGLVGSTTVALAFFPRALYVRFMAPRLIGTALARRAAEGEPG